MRVRFFSLLTMLFLSVVSASFAQTPTGTLQGTVTDQSGGAVVGATVRVISIGTNETKEFKTDPAGRYVLPFLSPDTYTVTVEATGFRQAKEDGVKIDVGQIRSVDFTMQVGQVTEQVEVQATTASLDVSNATLGTTIDNRKVDDLPLNGRNPFNLVFLTPGVYNNVGNAGMASTPHMGGSRNAVNEEQLDGITNIMPENNVGNNVAAYTPIVDSVQEFNVQINSLAAEYGRFGGGVINVVTKSGTNQLHGSGFDFERNGVLNANNFFANAAGSPKPASHIHQYGGTLGGPIDIPRVYNGHNKSFFFFGFEGTNTVNQAQETDTVPIAAFRTGDFSALGQTIYDPTTVHLDPSGSGNYIRNPFPGNVIPANRINAVGQNAINYFPAANNGAPGAQFSNYFIGTTTTNNDDHWDSRLDQNFTDKWKMFVRFSHDWNDNHPINDYGNVASAGWDGPANGGAWSVSMDHTLTLSPTLVADFRYGLSMSYVTRTAYGQGFNPTTLGLPQSLANIAAQRALLFPRFDIQNTNGLGNNGYVPLIENPLSHDFIGNVTRIMGAHTIKAGGEARILRINFTQYGQPDGQFEFTDPIWTQKITNNADGSGSAYADLLLGLPSYDATSQMTHEPTAASSSYYMGWYVQDDWKVTRKLTLNLGLRWEVEFPRTERYNRLSYWNPTAPSPLQGQVPASACPACGSLFGAMEFVNTPGSQYGRNQGPTQWKDFGPRVGFAYNAATNTVIRSGFGIAYAPSALQAAGTSGASGMEGFNTTTTMNPSFTTGRTIDATLTNPFPAGYNLPVGTANGTSTDIGNGIGESYFASYRNSYSIQWNFNIQQQLPGQMTIEAGYLGNRGLFLVDGDPGLNFNQLPSSYDALGNQLLNTVANPFYGVITSKTAPGSSLTNQTIQENQLLRPYPQYTGVQSFRKPTASSMYHGLTLRLNKRFSNGLSYLVSFTGGKSMDDSASAVTYLGPVSSTREDQYNRRLEWSISPQDVARSLVSSFVYDLPFGKGKRFGSSLPRGVNLLVSGWQANGIITWQTGTPIVLGGAQNSQSALFAFGQRPDNTGHSAVLANQSLNEWFNTSVFSQPTPYTFGTTSRTLPDVRNPGIVNADLSFFKNNRFGNEQRFNIQFRCEMFNSLNHPIFAAPDTGITDGNFGKVTGTASAVGSNPSREIQLAVKFLF